MDNDGPSFGHIFHLQLNENSSVVLGRVKCFTNISYSGVTWGLYILGKQHISVDTCIHPDFPTSDG